MARWIIAAIGLGLLYRWARRLDRRIAEREVAEFGETVDRDLWW